MWSPQDNKKRKSCKFSLSLLIQFKSTQELESLLFKTFHGPNTSKANKSLRFTRKMLKFEIKRSRKLHIRPMLDLRSKTVRSVVNWQSLEQRRTITAVTFLYKIQNDIVFVDHQHLRHIISISGCYDVFSDDFMYRVIFNWFFESRTETNIICRYLAYQSRRFQLSVLYSIWDTIFYHIPETHLWLRKNGTNYTAVHMFWHDVVCVKHSVECYILA
jgi:hypothetical protein